MESTEFDYRDISRNGIGLPNGILTITNQETKDHKTFQINTQPANAKFAANERIVSLLHGDPNDRKAWQGFGFVKDDGRIIVWTRHRDTKLAEYARLLERIAKGDPRLADRITVVWSGTCRFCNRTLTTPASIAHGYGPTCASNHDVPYDPSLFPPPTARDHEAEAEAEAAAEMAETAWLYRFEEGGMCNPGPAARDPQP